MVRFTMRFTWCVVLLGQPAVLDAEQHAASAAASSHRPRAPRAERARDSNRPRPQQIQITEAQYGLNVVVQLDHGSCTLDLRPRTVRAPGYRVLLDDGSGHLTNIASADVQTFRGTALEFPGSVVAAMRASDGLHARIHVPGKGEIWIKPNATSAEGANHDVFRMYEIDPQPRPCDADSAGQDVTADMMQVRQVAGATVCDDDGCVAELAIDTDSAYLAHWGSAEAVEQRIHEIINQVNLQFEPVGVHHAITTMIIRTAAGDPYLGQSSGELLREARTVWETAHAGVQRDLVQLYTGRVLDGNTIGTAYFGSVCTDYSYSVVQPECCETFGCATDLVAHEFGHNWGAGHCSCVNHTMNPIIFCANQFHADLTVPDLIAFRDTRTCLSANQGCAGDAECDDGLTCNGSEVCVDGQCLAGSPSSCDDGISCTLDVCSESEASCTHVGRDELCDNGIYCDGEETCGAEGCQSTPPCSGQHCHEGLESCVACLEDQHCDDGVPCTRDSCSSTGTCVVEAQDSNCDDGRWCNGLEFCDTASGCQDGAGVPCEDGLCNEESNLCVQCLADSDCDDGVGCTVDRCDLADGQCASLPDHDHCDNGVFCDGTEACHLDEGCLVGEAPCRQWSCDEQIRRCVECFDAIDCDDGLFCNGDELCSGGSCQAGAQPCTDAYCDEASNSCSVSGCNHDGVCDIGEDCITCASDCLSIASVECGNAICETDSGEDCVSCPSDCRGRQNGNPQNRFCCGDGDGENAVSCGDDRCHQGEVTCSDDPMTGACCGDLTCDLSEDACSCAVDCGMPELAEGPGSCADSVDNDCDGVMDCDDVDCGGAPACSLCLSVTPERGRRCRDNVDNDCDGLVDGLDPDCQ